MKKTPTGSLLPPDLIREEPDSKEDLASPLLYIKDPKPHLKPHITDHCCPFFLPLSFSFYQSSQHPRLASIEN